MWFSVPCAASAPKSDLQFPKRLVNYKSVNLDIAKAVQKRFSNHLWYLSEELVGLSFFDGSFVGVKRKT